VALPLMAIENPLFIVIIIILVVFIWCSPFLYILPTPLEFEAFANLA
jgi:hypothetical protein